jgi:hypothetical protein
MTRECGDNRSMRAYFAARATASSRRAAHAPTGDAKQGLRSYPLQSLKSRADLTVIMYGRESGR